MTAWSSKPWTNAGTRLWIAGEHPELLTWCDVRDIHWRGDTRFICPYCGSLSNGKCANCGGVGADIEYLRYQADDTEAFLSGVLPGAAPLFFLPDGIDLEILHKPCGDPSVYDQKAVIIRFLGCRIMDRKLANVMARGAGDEDWLRIGVLIQCTAELVLSADNPWRETVEQWQKS